MTETRTMKVSNDVSAFNPEADGVEVAYVELSVIRGDIQIMRKMDPDAAMELATKIVIAAEYARTGGKYCKPVVKFQIVSTDNGVITDEGGGS